MNGFSIKSTMINTGTGVMARIVGIIANLLLQVVLVYTLGIQYTGVSSLFTSVLTVLSLAELGIGNAVSYALYKPLAINDRKQIAAIMNFYKLAYRLISITVFIVGILLIPFLDYIIKDIPDIKESIILIYILYIAKTTVSYLLIYKSTLLIANQKNYLVLSVQMVMNVIRAIAGCLILFLLHNFLFYLVIEIVANIVQNLWISKIVDKKYCELKLYKNIHLEKEEKKSLLSGIKGVAMFKLSHCLGEGLDNVIVSAFVNTSAVGFMSNYLLIKEQLIQLLNQFYNSLIPGIGSLAVTASSDKQYGLFSRILFLNFWIGCFCSVSYFILIQPLITILFGIDYLLPTAIAAVITLDFYLACMLNVIASFRNANGLFIQGQYRPLVTTIMNVILSVIWGKKMGILGVLLATVVSRLLTQWYDPWLLFKYIFKKSSKSFFLEYYSYLFLTIICIGVTWESCSFLSVSNIYLNFVMRGIACIVIPNTLIFLIFHKTNKYIFCMQKLKTFCMRIAAKLSV